MKRVRLLNGTFDALTVELAADEIVRRIEKDERGYVCTVNVAYLMTMRRNPRLQRFVDRAALTVADGIPIVWASRWQGTPLPERVAGIDLMACICDRAPRHGLRVGLLGATADVVEAAATRLRRSHPGLDLCGAFQGYFSPEEAPQMAHAVRACRAQILFVGMGVPRQEVFLEDHWDALGVPCAMGVGGSFDVIAGRQTRAPKLVQRAGLEWAFRLAQEPRRLFVRYLVTNTLFLVLLARALARR